MQCKRCVDSYACHGKLIFLPLLTKTCRMAAVTLGRLHTLLPRATFLVCVGRDGFNAFLWGSHRLEPSIQAPQFSYLIRKSRPPLLVPAGDCCCARGHRTEPGCSLGLGGLQE